MLTLETIRARLAAQCASLSSRAYVVGDFAGAQALQACYPPAAFVGDYAQSYGSNFSLASTAQTVTATFAVWLAVRRTVDSSGEAWQGNLATPEAQVRAALHDWEPTTDFSPLALTAARLETATRHLAWWRMEFQTTFIECNQL